MLHRINHRISVLFNLAFLGFLAFCVGLWQGQEKQAAELKKLEAKQNLTSVK